MQVTKRNFSTALEQFKKDLSEAEFYAIDLEMSGIEALQPYSFDTPVELYLKFSESAIKYVPMQVGICLFKKYQNLTNYEGCPYNFYVCHQTPSSSPFRSNKNIVINIGAKDFLGTHNMDFNLWLKEGISYSNYMKHPKHLPKTIIDLDSQSSGLQPTVEEKNLLEKLSLGFNNWINDPSEKRPFFFKDTRPCLRSLFHDFLKKHTKQSELFITFVPDEKNLSAHVLCIHKKVSPEEDKDVQFQHDLKGFSAVIELLAEKKIPIVLHYGFNDLLFIYHHFIDELPMSYIDFKKKLNILFPKIYDTKYIQKTEKKLPFDFEKFQKCNLGDLFNLIDETGLQKIQVKINDEIYGYKKEGSKYTGGCHEAGFDALLTGCVYLNLKNAVGLNFDKEYLNKQKFYNIVQWSINFDKNEKDIYCGEVDEAAGIISYVMLNEKGKLDNSIFGLIPKEFTYTKCFTINSSSHNISSLFKSKIDPSLYIFFRVPKPDEEKFLAGMKKIVSSFGLSIFKYYDFALKRNAKFEVQISKDMEKSNFSDNY